MIFQVFGQINNPLKVLAPLAVDPRYTDQLGAGAGLFILFNNLIKLSIVAAGIFAFINIIMAGYGFLASVEPKEINKAWSRIWNAMMGLVFIAGSFVLAAIFGWIIFKDPQALLVPKLFGPGP